MNPTSKPEGLQLRAIVLGHVQGVGYRFFVMEQAHQLGLTGWVRNLPSGSVEVVAEGAKADLELLLNRLKRGPAGARVSDINSDWTAANGEFDAFRIAHY
jgi:acylphosphatase